MQLSRALSIILALESSLDFANGGDLASILHRIYRSAARSLNEAARYNDIAKVDEIRAAISNIAYAWKAVA